MLPFFLSFLSLGPQTSLSQAVRDLNIEIKKGGVDLEAKWQEVLKAIELKLSQAPDTSLSKDLPRWLAPTNDQNKLIVSDTFSVMNQKRSRLLNLAAGGDQSDHFATVFLDGSATKPSLHLLDQGELLWDNFIPGEVDVWQEKHRITIVGIFSNGGNAPPNGIRVYGYEESLGGWYQEEEILTDDEAHERPVIKVSNGRPQLDKIVCFVRVYPQVLSQCHACPHLLVRETWDRYGSKYTRRQDWVDTPLLALDQALLSLQSGDSKGARSRVVDPSILPQLKSFLSEGVAADSIRSEGDNDRGTAYDLRSGDHVYRATFKQLNGRWRLASMKKR